MSTRRIGDGGDGDDDDGGVDDGDNVGVDDGGENNCADGDDDDGDDANEDAAKASSLIRGRLSPSTQGASLTFLASSPFSTDLCFSGFWIFPSTKVFQPYI